MNSEEMERIALAILRGEELELETPEQEDFAKELRADIARMDAGIVTVDLPAEWEAV